MEINDDSSEIFYMSENGTLFTNITRAKNIRPVITLKKTALGDIDESIDTNIDKRDIVEKDNSMIKVNVSNTYLSKSLIIIIIGFIFACVSLVIYYIIKKKC